jgi:site-specific recombinase XerD
VGLRLVIASAEFRVHGGQYAGFPIILDRSMEAVQPATSFLMDICIANGRARSKRTWARYGQDMYDFFGFLEANKIDWARAPALGELSPIERYRDWANSECGNSPRTVNQRLRTIRRFYEWCVHRGLLKTVPFDYLSAHPNVTTFLQHVDEGREVPTPSFMLQETSEPIDVLSPRQSVACLRALEENEAHRLMFKVLLFSGLRSEEGRTFPERYVFDPRHRKDLSKSGWVRIKCKPTDMRLKGGKARSIDIPTALMEELYWWSVRERPKRIRAAKGSVQPHGALFVTE